MSIKGATTSASTTDIFTQSGSDEDGDLFASSATTKKHGPGAKPAQPTAQPSAEKKVGNSAESDCNDLFTFTDPDPHSNPIPVVGSQDWSLNPTVYSVKNST